VKQSAEDWTRATVVPGAGDGTLARVGPVVLLVGSTDPEVVRPYVDHAQMVAANGGQGRQLVRGYALMLSTAVEQSPGFAALAPHSTGLAVFVDGDVVVTVGEERISGADSLAWVERLIPWPIDEVTVTLPGASPADPASSYRLDGGVIQAGALVVPSGAPTGDSMAMAPAMTDMQSAPAEVASDEPTGEMPTGEAPAAEAPALPESPVWPETPTAPEPAAAPAPPAPPEPPPAPEPVMADDHGHDHAGHDHAGHDHPHPAPAGAPAGRPLPPAQPDEQIQFQSVLIGEMDDDDFEPLPLVDDVSVIQEAAGTPREEVRGVFCKNRHFNDPRQLFCAVCGINMVQQTPVLVNGVRPPLGVVVLDDGSVFQLDTPYLLGRDPNADERVQGGDFRGLPIIDQSNQVSRVHARLELRGWDVVLIDNNSTNGTFIHVPKTPDWQRLPPGGEHILVQGTRMRIGHRTLAFNTHAGG